MADKTTGELKAVNIGDLPGSADIYDDFKMPGELQGEAVHVTGAQFKGYAQQSTKQYADSAASSASSAFGYAATAQSAFEGVTEAIKNLPAGATVIINDLTTGGTSAALSAEMGKVLNRRPNPNLLHNWYFANPVNQRGLTEYATSGYTVDRWYLAALGSVVTLGKANVESGGLRLTGGGTAQDSFLRQKLENAAELVGRTVTLSVLVDDVSGTWVFNQYGHSKNLKIGSPGLYYLTFNWISNSTGAVQIWNSGAANGTIKIRAAKLELGDTQNLAHWDGSNWVLNEIPDYGEELAKCQRYYVKMSSVYSTGFVTSSAKNYHMPITLPVPMRVVPTPSMRGYIARTASGYTNRTGTSETVPEKLGVLAVSSFNSGNIIVFDSIAEAVDTNNSMISYAIYDLELSADL